MKILLIEDDAKTARFILNGLNQSGFVVDHSSDGDDGLFNAETRRYDAAIVDVMLPKRDGLSVITELRKRKINIPIIILSARRSVDDRILGLRTGSDDYLSKPFSFSELLARLEALIRRSNLITEPAKVVVADLELDISARNVFRGGKRIDVQPLEYALLEYLMRNTGRVVSKTMIMENVWEYNFDPGTNVVEARICKLREKIDSPSKVPADVLLVAKEKVPGMDVILAKSSATKNGAVYEIKGTLKRKGYEIKVNPHGKIVEYEVSDEIPLRPSDLPEKVKEAAGGMVKNLVITEAELNPKRGMSYALEGTADGRRFEIIVDKDGKVTKFEAEDDDDGENDDMDADDDDGENKDNDVDDDDDDDDD